MNSNEIILKYPLIFGEAPFDITKTLIGYGFECNSGWYSLLNNLFEEINILILTNPDKYKNFRIIQVKEKFSSLRIYCNYSSDEITKLIKKAQQKASKTCEYCGDDAYYSPFHSSQEEQDNEYYVNITCKNCR
jgi:hypothetical protein